MTPVTIACLFQIEKLPEDKLTVWQLLPLDLEAILSEKDTGAMPG
jgi:hypothetical protein